MILAADGKLDKQTLPDINAESGRIYSGSRVQHQKLQKVRLMISNGPKGLTVAFSIVALFVTVNAGELAMAADGLTTIKSNSGPQETLARLEAAVTAKGMTVFAHIDHGAGAVWAGLPLRPTDLLIFGSPKRGTPVMQSVQTVGIDLPLKALVWQDGAGITWLSYNAPPWIADRHGAGPETKAGIQAMATTIDAIAAAATSSPK